LFVWWKVISWKLFSKLSCICLLLRSWSAGNIFQLKKNLFDLVSRKVFSFYFFCGKYFLKVVKNLDMSYYLLIISNLVLKLLIAIYIYIYIILNIFFQFHPLEFDFYINLSSYFYNCYLLFSYHFLIEFFCIYQIWSSFFWFLLILFEIIYEIVIIIILISSSFNFFYLLDLISIILIIIYLFEIIYKIIFFFTISFSFNFLICKICSSLF